ncbi:Conserved_hypothetical protein [Hexamita inflata]|uniref:Integrase catalytic domain-containing protein n=1 Tax=Hexamita inflata TaxID=28002 RepID=A0AA86TXI1_9EUKA|nr:Conserved hypothetical protein [Hexamita inflata]
MTNQELVFVNQYDSWQGDLLELRDSKYMKEKLQKCFVSIFYNPATHMLHLKLITYKTPIWTVEHFKELQRYLVDNDLEPDIDTLTTDYGGEYKGVFEDYLTRFNVTHRVVLFDDLQLAPINAMCRYIRGRIQKGIQDLSELSDDQHDSGQVYINQDQLETILDNLMKFHNFEKSIRLYSKTPAKITREEVDDINAVKQVQNEELNGLYDFQLGDIIHVLLLKENSKFDKKRERKWSQGTYRIINKIGSFFQVVPDPFEFNQYVQTFKIQRGHPWGIPAYHRKCYQMKFAKFKDNKQMTSKDYFSYELENTNFYTFDKILAAVNNKGQSVKIYDVLEHADDIVYRIKPSDVNTFIKDHTKSTTTYSIKPSQLKAYDKSMITPVEDQFLFGMDYPSYYLPVFLMK